MNIRDCVKRLTLFLKALKVMSVFYGYSMMVLEFYGCLVVKKSKSELWHASLKPFLISINHFSNPLYGTLRH